MTAAASDMHWRKTLTGASAGGADSGVDITNAKHDLWPALTNTERLAGGTRTKKVALFNDHATDDYTLPSAWVTPADEITEELGLGVDDGDDDQPGQGNMTAFSANAVVAAISNGTDARTLHVRGLDAAGDPQVEDIVLTDAVEVLGLLTFSVVYCASTDSLSGTRTVTIKQGSAGTTRGTIGTNKKLCWLWLEANDTGTAIFLENLIAQTADAFWYRQTWAAAISGHRPDTSALFAVDN